MNKLNLTSDTIQLLENSEYFGVLLKYHTLDFMDIPEEGVDVYRTVPIVPIDKTGQTSRGEKKISKSSISRKISEEEAKNMSQETALKQIGNWGHSCNITEEQAHEGFLFTYNNKKANGADETDLLNYRKERGDKIVKLHITPADAILTFPDEHGHLNLFPYKNVDFENLRDKTYGYTTIPQLTYDDGEPEKS